jgi:hypothetical protein
MNRFNGIIAGGPRFGKRWPGQIAFSKHRNRSRRNRAGSDALPRPAFDRKVLQEPDRERCETGPGKLRGRGAKPPAPLPDARQRSVHVGVNRPGVPPGIVAV